MDAIDGSEVRGFRAEAVAARGAHWALSNG